MFEKSISQIEGFFPAIWFALSSLYFLLVNDEHISRFEYDIYYFILFRFSQEFHELRDIH